MSTMCGRFPLTSDDGHKSHSSRLQKAEKMAAHAQVRVSVLLFLLLCAFRGNTEIYLWNTNDVLTSEFYDCVRVHSSSLDYCRRRKEAIPLSRNNETTECEQNGGEQHRFRELRSKNVSLTTILLQWKSSLERLEDYLRYREDSSSQFDGSICECHQRGIFGKNCESQLPVGETFEETLRWQLLMREKNPEKVQIYGDVVCYETLECDSGVLCLDWREICDGVQHCLEGRDEENCDLLEMNQCDEDEYRCANEMCIPAEFFLDGEMDCLDWSNEIPWKRSENCSLESVSTECDDHLSPRNQWSCGDGECIGYRFQFGNEESERCVSNREESFICEMNTTKRRWTMSNG